MKNTIMMTGLLTVLLISPALAANSYDQRDTSLESRVDAGVQSGRITAKEQVNLNKSQARIDKYEDKAMASGGLQNHEKQKIRDMQQKQASSIRKQETDKEREANAKRDWDRHYWANNDRAHYNKDNRDNDFDRDRYDRDHGYYKNSRNDTDNRDSRWYNR